MANPTWLDRNDLDACPVHHADIAREYDYGRGDATVVKWECGCCASVKCDGLDDAMFHGTNYPEAKGRALLIVAGEMIADRRVQ